MEKALTQELKSEVGALAVNKAILGSTDVNIATQIGVSVAPFIKECKGVNDPLRSLIGEVENNQAVAQWVEMLPSQMQTPGDSGFFDEGGCPNEITPIKKKRMAEKFSYGFRLGLTEVALKATAGNCGPIGINGEVMSEEARVAHSLTRRMREFEDFAIINSTLATGGFAGINEQIVTNNVANGTLVMDLADVNLTRAAVDNHIAAMLSCCGAPDLIVTHPVIAKHLYELFNQMGNGGCCSPEDATPYIGYIMTSGGRVNIVADSNVQITFPDTNLASAPIYLLRSSINGEAVMYMDYLVSPSLRLTNQSVGCTSKEWMVWAHGTLVIACLGCQGAIINGTVSMDSAYETAVTTCNSILA